MLLQESGQRALQLTGAVPVDETHDPLIGQQRLVEKPLRARDGFVDAAADDVEIGRGRLARLQFHMYFDAAAGGRGSCAGDQTQVAEAGAHPLAAHVEVRRAVVNRGDDRFEPEAADDHAVAHRHPAVRGVRSAERGRVGIV